MEGKTSTDGLLGLSMTQNLHSELKIEREVDLKPRDVKKTVSVDENTLIFIRFRGFIVHCSILDSFFDFSFHLDKNLTRNRFLGFTFQEST